MISVRDAVPEDAPYLIHGNACMARETEGLALDPDTLGPGVRAVLADRGKGRYLVAEVEGKFAGQLMITWEWSDWRNGGLWWIQSVYVPPEFRRRGVFRALYAHVRELARREGAAGLRLYVEENNDTGQKTYTSLGMKRTHYLVMEETFKECGAG